MFLAKGADGLGVIAPGRGPKPVIDQAVIETIVTDTLEAVPDDESPCWTTRTLAERHDVGKDTVAGLWKKRRLRPWKVDTFNLSTDPDFESKMVDIVSARTATMLTNADATEPLVIRTMSRSRPGLHCLVID